MNGDPVCTSEFVEFHVWVNCYIELSGMHHYVKDPQWGLILIWFCNGTVIAEDIEYINKHCLVTKETVLPNNIRYATYYNHDRDAINTGLFHQFCSRNAIQEDGKLVNNNVVLLLSDTLQVQDTVSKMYGPLSTQATKRFWQGFGEDNVKPHYPK